MESEVLVTVTPEKRDGGTPADNCRALEEGKILYFPEPPLEMRAADVRFLLNQRQTDARFHKNIAYRPRQDRITGAAGLRAEDSERLHRVMRFYSSRVTAFLSEFLQPYASSWRLDYASFRPFQEQGRDLRLRARNDLLHVDNFPSRPTNGDRILRFFTNINPDEPRRWLTTDPFESVVRRMTQSEDLNLPQPLSGWRRWRFSLLRSGRRLGLPLVARSPYDEFMLQLHHAMKEDAGFQDTCPKVHLDFPPGSCWMVFTDSVPHAALSGQYALEQTFLISCRSMVTPESAPLRILERLSGRSPLTV